MSSGPAIYAGHYLRSGLGVAAALRDKEVLFHRDGATATVSVTRASDTITLRVNGKADASTAPGDMPTQVMLGHLPLLLHPDPRTVLVIGLGSGITAGSVVRHPIERLDIIEIEPVVVEASGFFAQENGNVLRDPRVRLTIADGRNFLLTTPERYDVIASEPSNPWLGGVASLFSVEFFQLARQHLRPGGLMLQWVHAYSLLPEDFQMIVKTFRTAFPSTSIWQVTGGDFLLLGRADAAPLDLNRLKNRYETNPGLRSDLARIGISDWAGILGYFLLGDKDATRYAEDAQLNTDDRLRLEFSAPRALYLDTGFPNWQLMRGFKTADLPDLTPESRGELERPEVRAEIGATLLRLGAPEDARRYLPAP
jgi:spermidine synthase